MGQLRGVSLVLRALKYVGIKRLAAWALVALSMHLCIIPPHNPRTDAAEIFILLALIANAITI